MDFTQPIPVLSFVTKYNVKISGDATILALGINEIHKDRTGDITFVDVEKYYLKSLS